MNHEEVSELQQNLRRAERLRERTRIARELHDTLLQRLVVAHMQLQIADARLPADSPAKLITGNQLSTRRAGKALCPRAEGSRTTLPQTFDELAAPHAKRIFRAAYRITRNRQDAEDAVQDALLQAFVHLEHFDGRSTFATWLTRIAINSSLMILRKRRHARAVSLEETADFDPSKVVQRIRDEAPDAEQQYLKKELKTSLQDAVRTLRPSLRKVVELGQLEDRSMKETADLLGVSLSAAKARLFHARRLLRRSQRLRGLYGYEPSGNQLSTRAPA
jgi:RNA polymerase sigma factor (sigma-70 family)